MFRRLKRKYFLNGYKQCILDAMATIRQYLDFSDETGVNLGLVVCYIMCTLVLEDLDVEEDC